MILFASIIWAAQVLKFSLNLANLTPHPFHVFLSYSHPPSMQQIEAIRALKT
jgi:Zn-dependent protease with chaperone function